MICKGTHSIASIRTPEILSSPILMGRICPLSSPISQDFNIKVEKYFSYYSRV